MIKKNWTINRQENWGESERRVSLLFIPEHIIYSGGSRGGARGPEPLLILGKKKKLEMTEGRKVSRVTKSIPGPPLAQGLDLRLT